MKKTNIVFGVYLIIYPIFLALDFNRKGGIYLGIVSLFILYLFIQRHRKMKIYKKLGIKYYLTASGGLFGIYKSFLLIGFLIIYLGLSYVVFREDFHKEGASSIGILFNIGVIILIFSSMKTSSIKISDDGIIDSYDTELVPYSNLKIDTYYKSKFKIKLRQKDSKTCYMILVDKSSEISYNSLIMYLESKIEGD